MDMKLILAFFAVSANGIFSLIIPEEATSLLSVAYSNIPPIKKGTDSRVGFGFSLGPHADFQVMFELGPQKNTGAIGSSFNSGTSKRQANNDDHTSSRSKDSSSQGSAYLREWYQSFRTKGKPLKKPHNHQSVPFGGGPSHEIFNLEDAVVDLHQNEKGEFELRQPKPSHMPAAVLYQLKQLYGQQNEVDPDPNKDMSDSGPGEVIRSEEEQRKITAELSDVDLEE